MHLSPFFFLFTVRGRFCHRQGYHTWDSRQSNRSFTRLVSIGSSNFFFSFFFFSSFGKDPLANIRKHCWKRCLKIWKLSWFKGETCKASGDITPQSVGILHRFVRWEGEGTWTCPPTIQTSENFGDFADLFLC